MALSLSSRLSLLSPLLLSLNVKKSLFFFNKSTLFLTLPLSLDGADLTLTWATEEGRSAVVVLEFWKEEDVGGMWSWEAAEARLEMAPVSMEKYILVSISQKTMRVR